MSKMKKLVHVKSSFNSIALAKEIESPEIPRGLEKTSGIDPDRCRQADSAGH